MKKVIFFLKYLFILFIVASMALHIFVVISFDDLLLDKHYRAPIAYVILVTIMTVIFVTYEIFSSLTKLRKILLVFSTLVLYSFLTVSIHGSWEMGYRNFLYPLIELKLIKTDSNADFELSDCDVNYFFYNIHNKYNKGILFRGITSIGVDSLCDKNINSPSYSRDAATRWYSHKEEEKDEKNNFNFTTHNTIYLRFKFRNL